MKEINKDSGLNVFAFILSLLGMLEFIIFQIYIFKEINEKKFSE
jgi:flagellar biogenesis protein FliO